MADLEIPAETLALEPAPTVTPTGAPSPSPFNFLFTGEDNLRVTSLNSVGGVRLEIAGRMWDATRGITPFSFTHTPNTDRTARSVLTAIGEGYLLHLSVSVVSGTPRVAQTFVRVQVVRGLTGGVQSLGTIAQGFVTQLQDLAWPGAPHRWTTDINPPARTINGTIPAAGVEISESVPVGARWEIVAFCGRLDTDGTAADRRPILRVLDGVNTIWRSAAPTVLTANSIAAYTWGAAAALESTISGTNFATALPVGLTLQAGQSITTLTTNLQAGDQYIEVTLLIREWLEGDS